MIQALAQWNLLPAEKAEAEILPCCGSHAWARAMAARRPLQDEATLLAAGTEVWKNLPESEWLEAFRSHPPIGESQARAGTSTRSAEWSRSEQGKVVLADPGLKDALVEGNRAYEQKFGRIFIVCATGKSAPEILDLLKRRLQSDERTELWEAAEQQRQIMHLRLKKWLNS